MKKYILPFIILLALGCSKFDELSKNPYAIYEAPAEEYVHPIMFKTQYSEISFFRTVTCLLMQYGVSRNTEASSRVVSNYNVPEGLVDDMWELYTQYGNAVKMYDKAVQEKNPGLQGVALILKSYLMLQITDTYGDVPFFDAGQLVMASGISKYTMAYDSQKDIYLNIIAMLEDANTLLGSTEDLGFNSICDKTFGGSYERWRRLGNSLYARVLLRVGMKVMAETAGTGIIEFDDEDRDPISVPGRLADIYQCFMDKTGNYPVMRSREDRPMIHFDKQNETEQTPFFSYTSGSWNAVVACDALTRRMLETEQKIHEIKDENGNLIRPCGDLTIYVSKDPNADGYTGHAPDPRFDCWWRKMQGMPTQLSADNVRIFYQTYLSNAGNFKGGSMMRGAENEPGPIWGHVYDLQNASEYPMMQFSELPFIFAEAGARGWIASISSSAAVTTLLRQGITESILEWNPYVSESSDEVVKYVSWVTDGELFSGKKLSADNALEAILTEKWIANFFIGGESWCDYRRTGFPILKTNGEAAGNDYILPTRLRYPSDEAYRNTVTFNEALKRWLGGTNNMQTDVWWADTQESKNNRLLGIQ